MADFHTRNTRRDWLDAVAVVRALAAAYPVEVRRCNTAEDTEGECKLVTKGARRFVVRIDRTLSFKQAIETLVHEAAHVLDWHPDSARAAHHGPTWGVRYAEVYRAIYGEP